MIVGIYNPYHDTLGGGEQYMFTFASYFLKKNHSVLYFTNNPGEVSLAEERFGISLSHLETRDVFDSRGLDVLLFYSDGSLPFSFAKKTYCIFQFPVPWVRLFSPITLLKRLRIADIIVNSEFTKKFIDKTFFANAHVVYPSIHIDDYKEKKKEKIILSVGRLTKGMNAKKQEILIQAFQRMVDDGLKEWKLILAGGILDADKDEEQRIRRMIHGYPIELLINISRDTLLDLYGEAMVYWHATGYGEDESNHPECVEHFGISTVEAMASGAIPLVYPAGGQKEIVEHGISGMFWKSKEELTERTLSLIKDQKKATLVRKKTINRAKQFDTSIFYQTLDRIFL